MTQNVLNYKENHLATGILGILKHATLQNFTTSRSIHREVFFENS